MNPTTPQRQSYQVQPGHVVNASEGRLGVGDTLDLSEDEAKELGAAVALAPPAQALAPAPDAPTGAPD
jgi:hypothetical protein